MRIYILTNNHKAALDARKSTLCDSFKVEFIKPFSHPSIKKYYNILKENDVIIHCELANPPLPFTFWDNIFAAWKRNGFYLKCTGNHILLDGLLVEIFSKEALVCVEKQRHHFLPDGSLNAFIDQRAAPYWLTIEEQRFYLLEKFLNFYAKPTAFCIEVTPLCNLKCGKCQFHSLQSPYTTKANKSLPGKSMMSLEEWKQIIGMINNFSRQATISPAMRGECLMHNDIVSMVKYAAKFGHQVGFYTNGNLLTAQKSEALIDAGLGFIIFSLDAINEEQYNKLQPGGNFTAVVKNIQTILKIRGRKKSPSIGVSFCMSKENVQYFEEYANFWKGQVDTVSAAIELDINKGHGAWKTFYPLPSYLYPCPWLWKAMYIHSNGNVATCGMDMFGRHNLGNVFAKDILSIWNSNEYMQIRKNQAATRKDLRFCQLDISWSGFYSIDKIEPDGYCNIGPMSYTVSKLKIDPRIYNLAVMSKAFLMNSGVPQKIIKKLQDLCRPFLG